MMVLNCNASGRHALLAQQPLIDLGILTHNINSVHTANLNSDVRIERPAIQHLTVLELKSVLLYLLKASSIVPEDQLELKCMGHHHLSTDKPPLSKQAGPIAFWALLGF